MTGSSQPVGKLPKVLYIAGWQRSGSTILDHVLGQLEGFVSTGELRSLWELSMVEGFLCGCGAPLAACPFWRSVQDAGGVEQSAEARRRVVALQGELMRARPQQLARIGRATERGGDPAVDAYVEARLKLYGGLRASGGAHVVVDSSKHPAEAYLLSHLAGLELYVVQIVRDPRAVAYSWSRRLPSPDDPRKQFLEGYGPLSSSVWWLEWNAVIDGLVRRRLGRRYLLVRYEDFMARPAETVRAICELVGESCEALPFTGEGTVELAPNHTVAGNPRSRFLTGRRELRQDEEWRSRLPRRARLLATLAAAPLMPRFGYRLTRAR